MINFLNVLHNLIWILSATTFWINYSGTRYDEISYNKSYCNNSYAYQWKNNVYNCSKVTIENFDTFREIAYSLFRLTFGGDIKNEDKMYKIDSELTAPLIGSYIGSMGLVFVNVFIALLGYSLSKTYDIAEAYMYLERAREILDIENSMENIKCSLESWIQFNFHLKILEFLCFDRSCGRTYNDFYKLKKYNPYRNKKSNDTLDDDRINNIENRIFEQAHLLVNIYLIFFFLKGN
jgi:hypothetical protein